MAIISWCGFSYSLLMFSYVGHSALKKILNNFIDIYFVRVNRVWQLQERVHWEDQWIESTRNNFQVIPPYHAHFLLFSAT